MIKRNNVLLVCVILSVAFIFPLSIFADGTMTIIESIVVESFDPEDKTTDWIVTGSKFATEGYPKQVYAKTWPESLWGINSEGKDLQVLGVNAKFNRQGHNCFEIIPVVDANAEEVEHNPLKLEGLVKNISCWVWGSNFNYDMEVHLMDYNGVVWIVPLGSLKYVGWKNLVAEVSSTIPQTSKHIPFYRSLTLQKFVIWTNPEEAVNDFYLYLDQIRISTDLYASKYDGNGLTSPEKLEEMWGGK